MSPSKAVTVPSILRMKTAGKKLSVVTCYDFSMAKIINQTNIDILLVGDSVASVIHGYDTTLSATVEMMAMHTSAVVRGAPDKFVVADMPFLSYRKGLKYTMDAVEKLMQAGAHALKLEGVAGHENIIEHIVQSGVPVMGHLGLTPQSYHRMGGHKVQGRDEKAVKKLHQEAQTLQNLGGFALVLECLPASCAADITASLNIPTIGIGAGANVEGQVLVLNDLLGMSEGFKPTFLRQYLKGENLISEALNRYDMDVKQGNFPSKEESYS